ncbi:unnamed protein product [Allacma fusca]|uniref:Uncharacterized protein n=1 Tax=Allacma fusca TaxID=39272 RepID=A0A8J2J464_9HEXA|nr:unnamed protein product [Allacma fusca]
MWKVSKSVNGSAHYVTPVRLICQEVFTIHKGRSQLEKLTYFNSLINLPLSKTFHTFPQLRVTYNKSNFVPLKTSQNFNNSNRFFTNNSNNRRPIPPYVIPGTSAAAAAAGLAQGTVTEKQFLVDDETLRREKLRSWNFRRYDPTMVPLARSSPSETTPPRGGVSPEEITCLAENFLGSDRFSSKSSLSQNFGQFQQIISLFLLKVSDVDHPLLHITKIIESEPSHSEGSHSNPYPLWRAMLILLGTEMFGFPPDIAAAPPEVHWAIRDKHNLVGKIAEIMWVAHQLHRRILDVATVSNNYLPRGQSLHSKATMELLEDIHKANKATTLIGDLLLTQKCAHLAALKSPVVTELICNSLADYCESEFDLGVEENDPRYFSYQSWLDRTELGLGSLLGHCMYSTLLFSGFNPTMRKRAFKLGSLIGVFYQAYDDIMFFRRKSLTDPSWLDVSTLPVALYIQNNRHALELPHTDIFDSVKYCESTMPQSLAAFKFFKEQVLLELSSFHQVGNTTARDLLINFVHSLKP